jgi:hypothetical protein
MGADSNNLYEGGQTTSMDIDFFSESGGNYRMPVNMDPSKKRRRTPPSALPVPQVEAEPKSISRGQFGEETEEDRIKALADAENKNLWDATEVIDMDKF